MSYYCKGRNCDRSSECLRVEAYNQFPYKDLEEGFETGLWYVKEDECTVNGYEDGVFYDNNKNNQKEDKQ